MEYENNQDAFDKICGNCAGVGMNEITDDDIRAQAKFYNVDATWIEAAMRGLHEYQNEY